MDCWNWRDLRLQLKLEPCWYRPCPQASFVQTNRSVSVQEDRRAVPRSSPSFVPCVASPSAHLPSCLILLQSNRAVQGLKAAPGDRCRTCRMS